jgi:class 3 adenylate cyclase
MLNSKQLIEQAGISRATLNNYIALGILPKPVVQRSGPEEGRAPRLGYFPEEALRVIAEVQRLKQEGLSMARIAARFRGEHAERAAPVQPARVETTIAAAPPAAAATPAPEMPRPPMAERRAGPGNGVAPANDQRPVADMGVTQRPGQPLRVTIADIPGPAYMVNNNFEAVWWNDQAAHDMFGVSHGLQGAIEERNVFRLLMKAAAVRKASGWHDILSMHLGVAKKRMPRENLSAIYTSIGSTDAQLLEHLYDSAEPVEERPTAHRFVNVLDPTGAAVSCNLYASFFREGILFAYVPATADSTTLLDLLSRREQVIRDLLHKRMPFLTHVGCLVADLQNSVQICAELPPEEYFALINHIWQASEPVFRKYYGTHGKHVGDGMVYYFFPQPDCNYVLNAINCAHDLKEVMREVSREWQARKNWLNDLYLNTGLNEGQEWFGTYHTATNLEFTVLGDTINHAARVSDFARFGSVWVTKNMLGRLTPEERQKVRFGIRRKTERGDEVFVSDLYARISSMVDLSEGQHVKFRDIATLAVTEVVDVIRDDEGASAAPAGGGLAGPRPAPWHH